MSTLTAADVLSLAEVDLVLRDGKRRARRSLHTHQNLIIFELATCCGLRASEIAGLELRDVHPDRALPCIVVRKAVAKRARPRKVPLAWDQGSLADLRAWCDLRRAQGARETDPVVCTMTRRAIVGQADRVSEPGTPLDRKQVYGKFRAALRPLGPERARELHTHCGRHTYGTHMVAVHPVSDVQSAMGHANLATTGIYLHITPERFAQPGNVFSSAPEPPAPGAQPPPAP
jgi:integrase